ncbi:MAG: nucleotidyltransferase domain-containing protein [Deltaproteobacteria bacterium]|nr:nucleotidyltransferase domain-containing protein [Deltaproteobacteria bacterium]MBI2974321.1 nucleotidyltransferase domain-containing protein [Deltaproteobacteria bacterium]
MLKRGGIPGLDYLASSVVSVLSENFLIYKGGVLIGSHAFQAYSGMFGATFEKSSLRTLDIDIACDNTVTAYSTIPLNIGYLPSSFVGPSGIRVDIVTPLRGKPRGIIKIKNIVDAAAIPLRFLDFLIKKPVDSVLIGVRGGIPVTVPHPARYAVHKLIISSQRPVSESAKSAKDIIQAEQIILICAKEQPYELKRAFHEAMRQGPKWKKYIEKGMLKLSSDARSALQ